MPGVNEPLLPELAIPVLVHCHSLSLAPVNPDRFLADRTIGRAYGTVCRLSSVVCLSVCLSVVCDFVLWQNGAS